MILKHLGFGITVVAIICFVPGIVMPMFVLNMDMAIALAGTGFNSQIVSKELSVLATVKELWQDHRYLVSVLIFAFSIVIPVAKTALVILVYFMRSTLIRHKIISAVNAIGKWSMADVFVVAVFLAILSTNHADSNESHQMAFLGMKIGFEVSTQTLSNVGLGFYYFVAYCILSLMGSQMIMISIKSRAPEKSVITQVVDDTP